MITLYDIPSQLPGQAWSPNTFKARFALNFKGLPFETKWVEYPDIAALYQSLGAKTLDFQSDGVTPSYTLPLILDDSAPGKEPITVSDSWAIAEYLDEAYPDTPRLFPKGTKALQAAFQDAFWDAFVTPATPIVLPRTAEIALNEASKEYFYRTREVQFGKPLQDIEPHGEAREKHFKDWEAQVRKIAKVYEKAEGKHLTGDQAVYADLIAAAFVWWARVIVKEEEWETISGWYGGLVGRIGETAGKYAKSS